MAIGYTGLDAEQRKKIAATNAANRAKMFQRGEGTAPAGATTAETSANIRQNVMDTFARKRMAGIVAKEQEPVLEQNKINANLRGQDMDIAKQRLQNQGTLAATIVSGESDLAKSVMEQSNANVRALLDATAKSDDINGSGIDYKKLYGDVMGNSVAPSQGQQMVKPATYGGNATAAENMYNRVTSLSNIQNALSTKSGPELYKFVSGLSDADIQVLPVDLQDQIMKLRSRANVNNTATYLNP